MREGQLQTIIISAYLSSSSFSSVSFRSNCCFSSLDTPAGSSRDFRTSLKRETRIVCRNRNEFERKRKPMPRNNDALRFKSARGGTRTVQSNHTRLIVRVSTRRHCQHGRRYCVIAMLVLRPLKCGSWRMHYKLYQPCRS